MRQPQALELLVPARVVCGMMPTEGGALPPSENDPCVMQDRQRSGPCTSLLCSGWSSSSQVRFSFFFSLFLSAGVKTKRPDLAVLLRVSEGAGCHAEIGLLGSRLHRDAPTTASAVLADIGQTQALVNLVAELVLVAWGGVGRCTVGPPFEGGIILH